MDEFLFLEGRLIDAEEYRKPRSCLAEIIGSQESTERRKPQPKSRVNVGAPGDRDQSQPTLRNFVQLTNENEDTRETNNIVMNEDGAMYAG